MWAALAANGSWWWWWGNGEEKGAHVQKMRLTWRLLSHRWLRPDTVPVGAPGCPSSRSLEQRSGKWTSSVLSDGETARMLGLMEHWRCLRGLPEIPESRSQFTDAHLRLWFLTHLETILCIIHFFLIIMCVSGLSLRTREAPTFYFIIWF